MRPARRSLLVLTPLTFTVTETDGNVPTTYTSAVTYTVTLNVNGSLSATAANSMFTYVIGTNSNDLPLVHHKPAERCHVQHHDHQPTWRRAL